MGGKADELCSPLQAVAASRFADDVFWAEVVGLGPGDRLPAPFQALGGFPPAGFAP